MGGLDEVYLQHSRDASAFAARGTQHSMEWLRYILDRDNHVNLVSMCMHYAPLKQSESTQGRGQEAHQDKAVFMIDVKSVHANGWGTL
jgi:hypothetical protein